MKNFYYDILYYLARFSDRSLFWPLHYGAAQFYTYIVTPTLQQYLRWQLETPSLRLKARHSAVNKQKFNIFLSDLDLSIYFKDNSDPVLFLAAAEKLKKWKRFLIFLGELEIYQDSEARIMEDLLKKNAGVYEFTRNLRKLHWIQKDRPTQSHPYQLYKSDRALKKLWQQLSLSESQLGAGLGRWCQEVFPQEISQVSGLIASGEIKIPDSVYSDYWGLEMSKARGFRTETIAFFMAAAPEDFYGDGSLNKTAADVIQAVQGLSHLRCQLAEIEALTLQGWARTFSSKPPWVEPQRLKLLSMSRPFFGS